MKEYKRLTERVGKGICVKETSTCANRSIWKAIERLAEFEDKIENGTLIELPCKVGDIVYQFDNGGRIYEATILNIEIYKGKPYYKTCGVDFDNTAIGESIFLTKAEAEAKLKEVQEV